MVIISYLMGLSAMLLLPLWERFCHLHGILILDIGRIKIEDSNVKKHEGTP